MNFNQIHIHFPVQFHPPILHTISSSSLYVLCVAVIVVVLFLFLLFPLLIFFHEFSQNHMFGYGYMVTYYMGSLSRYTSLNKLVCLSQQPSPDF